MSTYSRRGIHGHVVDALGLRILSGRLSPGDVIDPDALLAEFGVSRTVLREALKVLAAKGLVDARPRTGTYITERARWQLLDVDVMNWRSRGAADPILVLELGEVRQAIEPAAARMAAARRTDQHVELLVAAIARMARSDRAGLDDAVQADLEFHRTVLLAAGNELLLRFEFILEPALRARDELAHRDNADRSFVDAHRAVSEAIIDRDPDRAYDLMAAMMAVAAQDAEMALSRSDR